MARRLWTVSTLLALPPERQGRRGAVSCHQGTGHHAEERQEHGCRPIFVTWSPWPAGTECCDIESLACLAW